MVITINIIILIIATDHAVHGRKQTEDHGKHLSRQELLPKEPRRSQPEDEIEDEYDKDEKDEEAENAEYEIIIAENVIPASWWVPDSTDLRAR